MSRSAAGESSAPEERGLEPSEAEVHAEHVEALLRTLFREAGAQPPERVYHLEGGELRPERRG